MSAWARKRQSTIIMYVILTLLLLATIGYFRFGYNPPTCFDGEKNGVEEGVDCGGTCQLVCPFKASKPNIEWARAFEIAPGLYNFASSIENPNFSVGAETEYVFRAYNKDNIQIAEVFGKTPLYPTEKKVIFEPSVDTGERRISRTFMEFIGSPNWYEIPKVVKNVIFKDYVLEDTETSPKLQAKIFNTSVKTIRDVVVTAVLYDENENIMQVSQTYVEAVPADGEAVAFFTWRKPFDSFVQNVQVFISEPQ